MDRRTADLPVSNAVACAVETLESRTLFALVVFTIDPALSSLRLSGDVAGIDLDEQRSGSLLAAYEGTIAADLGSGVVSFPGDSNVVARATRSYSPGDGLANYGGEAETGGIFSVKIGEAALRNLKFDLESDALVLAESGAFDAGGLRLQTTGGRLDYDLRIGSDGDIDLDGETVTNNGAGNATLRGTGSAATLTIPIDIDLSEDAAELRLRGTMVANLGGGAPVDPNAIRLGDGTLVKGVQFVDADGTISTVTLKGGGTADVRFENATTQSAGKGGEVIVGGAGVRLVGVEAVGTTGKTKLTLGGKGGTDGTVLIPSLTTDGPAGSIGGKGVTFGGPLTVNGRLGGLTAASLAGATVTADSLGTAKITGDVTTTTITLDAPFTAGSLAVGKLTVGGAFSQSRLTAAGRIGPVKATTLIRSEIYSAVSPTAARFPAATELLPAGAIGGVTAKTFADTVIAADALGKLKLGTIVTDNDAAPTGLTADTLAGLTATNESQQKLKLTAQDDPAALATALAAQTFAAGDFVIRLA